MIELAEFIHPILAAFAMVAVVFTDVKFMKFLGNDKRIDKKEAKLLHRLSLTIWIVLFLLIVTGVIHFYEYPDKFLSSSKFMLKMTVVSIIIVNGALLNGIVYPKISKLNFKNLKNHGLKKAVFTMGSISAVSWVTAYVLGYTSALPFSYLIGLSIYILAILFAIGVSWMIFDIKYYPD